MISFHAPVVGTVLLIAAVLTGWYSRRLHRRQSIISKTPTTDLGQLSEAPIVEVQAEVIDGETFDSPIGNKECVLSVWEVMNMMILGGKLGFQASTQDRLY
jgi:hypothetical protein